MREKSLILLLFLYLLAVIFKARNLYSFIFITSIFLLLVLIIFFPYVFRRFLYKIKNRLIFSHLLAGLIPVVLLIIMAFLLVYVMFAGFTSTLIMGWFDYKFEEMEKGEAGVKTDLQIRKGFEGIILNGKKFFLAVNRRGRKIFPINNSVSDFFMDEYGIKVYLPPYLFQRQGKKVNIRNMGTKTEGKGFSFPVIFSGDVYSFDDGNEYDGAVFLAKATFGSLVNGIVRGKSSISNSLFFSFLFFAIVLSFLNLAAMGGGFLITMDITKALSKFSFAVRAIKNGNLSIRIKTKRKDELGRIMESFDGMVKRLGTLAQSENIANMLEEEIRIARKIQLRLMPPQEEEIPYLEHSALTIAARGVGGDFYDIIKEGENCFILMADVSGRGLYSSLFGAMLKGVVTAFIRSGLPLKSVVEKTNEILFPHLHPTHFITFTAVRLSRGEMEVARAGHQPMILYRPFSTTGLEEIMLIKPAGIGIGILKNIEKLTKTTRIQIEKGDILVLFTDGLSELPSSSGAEMFGTERIERIIKKNSHLQPQQILDRILTEAERFFGREIPPDDIAVFVGKVK